MRIHVVPICAMCCAKPIKLHILDEFSIQGSTCIPHEHAVTSISDSRQSTHHARDIYIIRISININCLNGCRKWSILQHRAYSANKLIKVVGGKSKIRREIEEAITKKKLLKVKISSLKEGMKEIKLNEKPQQNLLRQSHVPLV